MSVDILLPSSYVYILAFTTLRTLEHLTAVFMVFTCRLFSWARGKGGCAAKFDWESACFLTGSPGAVGLGGKTVVSSVVAMGGFSVLLSKKAEWSSENLVALFLGDSQGPVCLMCHHEESWLPAEHRMPVELHLADRCQSLGGRAFLEFHCRVISNKSYRNSDLSKIGVQLGIQHPVHQWGAGVRER